jgi:hypothetical protein
MNVLSVRDVLPMLELDKIFLSVDDLENSVRMHLSDVSGAEPPKQRRSTLLI